MCAFPLHFWTMILVFRDVSWVIERTNVWDAVGVGSYGMLFAFLESVIIFIVVTLLGFITPKQWEVNKRIAFLSLLVLITALWGMISQLLFLWNVYLPGTVIRFIAHSAHPLWVLYSMSLAIVVPTILLPFYLFIRSDKSTGRMRDLAERLSVLTVFYLFIDLLGLIIVIVRNIP
jgi:hypothetical protein